MTVSVEIVIESPFGLEAEVNVLGGDSAGWTNKNARDEAHHGGANAQQGTPTLAVEEDHQGGWPYCR